MRELLLELLGSFNPGSHPANLGSSPLSSAHTLHLVGSSNLGTKDRNGWFYKLRGGIGSTRKLFGEPTERRDLEGHVRVLCTHFPCHGIAPHISLCAARAQSSETPRLLLRPQAGGDLGSGRTPPSGSTGRQRKRGPMAARSFTQPGCVNGGSQGLLLTTRETDTIWGLLGLRVTDTAVSGRKSRETTA